MKIEKLIATITIACSVLLLIPYLHLKQRKKWKNWCIIYQNVQPMLRALVDTERID